MSGKSGIRGEVDRGSGSVVGNCLGHISVVPKGIFGILSFTFLRRQKCVGPWAMAFVLEVTRVFIVLSSKEPAFIFYCCCSKLA